MPGRVGRPKAEAVRGAGGGRRGRLGRGAGAGRGGRIWRISSGRLGGHTFGEEDSTWVGWPSTKLTTMWSTDDDNVQEHGIARQLG
jgi:hypothetical protein